jgi:hypothetical protein
MYPYSLQWEMISWKLLVMFDMGAKIKERMKEEIYDLGFVINNS